MTYLFNIIVLCLVFLLTSCDQTDVNSSFAKVPIKNDEIERIEIKNNSIRQTNGKIELRELTNDQAKTFVDKWNKSKSKGPCKFGLQYWLFVTLRDGTKRTFKANGETIKEESDWCNDIGEENFFTNLWSEIKVNHVQNISNVFDDYVKYEESTDSEDNQNLMTKSIGSLSQISSQNELKILIDVWMYYDPTDFPTRSLIFKILKESRPESILAVKARIENKNNWEKESTAPYSELNNLLEQLNNE